MDFNNLRRFPRAKVNFPIMYKVGGKNHRGRALELGGNGLLLEGVLDLPPGTELTFRFRPGKRLQNVEARAQVRSQILGKGVGLEFTSISPEDRKVILGVVLSRLRQKRIYPRRPLVVQVEHGAKFLLAFSRNISVGGMFLGTKDPLPTGSETILRFPLDDDGPTVVAKADVRYSAKGYGMGVKFTSLSPEDRSRIDVYVTKGESSVDVPGQKE
jgi:c-di-GMP-binding flagellar brake protein YcgR